MSDKPTLTDDTIKMLQDVLQRAHSAIVLMGADEQSRLLDELRAAHAIVTTQTKPKTGTVRVVATCPHCEFESGLQGQGVSGEGYDNSHNLGRGGYRVICESCGDAFMVEADTVHDLQHTALVMLGEAEE